MGEDEPRGELFFLPKGIKMWYCMNKDRIEMEKKTEEAVNSK